MKTIREYFCKKAISTNTEAEFEAVCAEEQALYEAYQNEEIDIEAWAAQNGVDITTTNAKGVSELTLWCWDMSGD